MSNRPKTSSPPIGPPGGGDPTKKAMNFGPSLKRLLGRLSPDKPIVVLIFALVTASVVLSSIAPKILGNATNLIFDGIVSKQLQPGTTKEQAVEELRALRGRVSSPTWCPAWPLCPEPESISTPSARS